MRELEDIERRADRLNVSINRVCLEAGVGRNTLSRWRSGRCSPKISTFERDIAKLKAVLDRMEAAMREALGPGRRSGDDTMIRAGTAA